MKIKSVEICGFKSFPEKTIFNFQSPITAIVGPNGCGKSNVVDAVKWVIGETSMKELRGSLMEDCIFVGSEVREPLNMAEVTIVLSNTDGRSPAIFADTPEISVKRRYFRDGESEYFINNTACRLKDITDIFVDSGVGTETYSIIEQGSVERIVSSKPDEKRLVIEEAAGITKYKSRKNTAQRKMDSTRQNLLRINDIIHELKRQIGSITRQAKKAERYKLLKEELDSLQLSLQIKSFQDIFAEIERSKDEEGPLRDKMTEKIASIENLEAQLEKIKLELMEEEEVLASKNAQIFEKSSQMQRAQSRIESIRTEIESCNASRHSRGGEIESLLERISSLEEEIDLSKKKIEEAHAEIELQQKEIEAAKTQIEESKTEVARSVQREEKHRQEIFEAANSASRSKNNLENIDRSKREIELRLDRLSREKTQMLEQIGAIRSESEKFHGSREELVKLKDEIGSRLKQKNELLREHENSSKEASARLLENDLKLNEAKARLSALVEYETQMKDLETPMKEILQRSGDRDFGNVSLIADVFSVKEGFEIAAQAALGNRFRGIVASSNQSKLDIIEHIRQNRLLRNVIIDKEIRPRENGYERPEGAEGFLGVLAEFISPIEGYGSIVDLLFNDYLVFEDMEKAHRFWVNTDQKRTVITLGGEMIDPSGIVEAGRFSGLGGGIFERRQEISDKKSLIEGIKEENQSLRNKIESVESSLGGLESEIEDLNSQKHAYEIKIIETDKDIDRKREMLDENENRIALIEREISENKEAIGRLEQERSQNIDSENRSIELNKQLEFQLISLKEDSASLEKKLEEQQRALMEKNAKLATLRERNDNIGKEIGGKKGTIETYRSDIDLKQQEIASLSGRILDLEKESKEKDDEVNSARIELDELKNRIDEYRAGFTQKKERISSLEKELKGQKAALEELKNRINEITIKVNELRVKRDMLLEQVRSNYGIDLEGNLDDLKDKIPADEELEELRKRSLDLRQKVDSLGDVNIGAIEELKELEQRHEFLEKQKQDLDATLVNLDKMIRRINQTSKKKFAQAFEEINARFQEVFPKLFEGGKAYLKLLDEENLLESGIDIVAQPRGTKLQNINLLSGGQKALTAIALLIAIFLHKPSPFCILDEVDAPLDDANVLRFIDIIKELSQRSQFIVITHNKVTMEVAHTLYGVTMEEKGVSKVVSVNFTDSNQRRRIEATIAA